MLLLQFLFIIDKSAQFVKLENN